MTTHTHYEDGVLTVTRVYDAPREHVFDAWVAVAKVQQWWGCGDTTNVRSTIDAEAGGRYQHQMTLKNVHEHTVEGVITAYDPPKLLEYTTSSPKPGETMTVRVEFIDQGARTQVRLTHHNIPSEFGSVVTDGWTAAFAKLDRFLLAEAADAAEMAGR